MQKWKGTEVIPSLTSPSPSLGLHTTQRLNPAGFLPKAWLTEFQLPLLLRRGRLALQLSIQQTQRGSGEGPSPADINTQQVGSRWAASRVEGLGQDASS